MTVQGVPWRQAWHTALYGDEGFFRRGRPADHFRTSAHVPAFAEAISELARRHGAATIVDLGAGGGELLTALRGLLGGDVRLVGVEVAPRPPSLPVDVDWLPALPDHIDGLLVANEWLDNVPCDVVELGSDGVLREVLVNPATGEEALGDPYESSWIDSWWPLDEPGARAEVGEVRDEAWADAVARVDGVSVAIDYGHTRATRPLLGSLRSYVAGHEVEVRPDGSRDVTAHVAADSLAARVGATVTTQRHALAALGLDGSRPPLELATSDPLAYVSALSRAGEAGELLARGGWGDFWWVQQRSAGAA
ncbi:MAG: hypothetical protein JWP31_1570 [Aeromicrobium sp.]|nr:hypothetical protein [Aeromicrobium sp.]